MPADVLNRGPAAPQAAQPHAVVVNDDATQLAVLCGLVRKAGLEPRAFAAAEAALAAMAAAAPPALVVTDLHMPGIDGWRFCRLLRSSEYAGLNGVPIVVVSSIFTGEESDRIAADLGVDAFLSSPVSGRDFVVQVQAIVEGRPRQSSARLLIVDADRAAVPLLQSAFAAHGYLADAAFSMAQAEECLARTHYEVAVIDQHLPDGNGSDLLETIQARDPDCVRLMTTVDPSPERAVEWMRRGAAAYLRKPFAPEYLVDLCSRARRERALLRVPEILEERTRQLRESEANFRALFETIGDPVVVAAADGRILYANPALFSKLGCAPDDLQRLRLTDLHPADVRPEAEAIFAAMLRGERQVCPLPLLREDGTRMPAETRAWFGKWNGLNCVMGISKDLSAELEAEQRFEKLFRHCPIPTALSTVPDGRFADVNDAFAAMTGYAPEEVVGRTAAELDLFPDMTAHREAGRRLRADGRLTGCELQVRRRDGTTVDGLFSGELIAAHGKQYAITAMVDMTERQQVEREREMALSLLSIVNRAENQEDLLRHAAQLLQQWSGCHAVGIRRRCGDEFPYCETRGLPQDFVAAENSLCVLDAAGQVQRDSAGNPVLDCMCGNVLMGRFDPNLPFFTPHGTFWTNSTTDLLASTTDAERQARTRNRCHGEGYESVALIPLRQGSRTFGLIQLNDPRRGRFSPSSIAMFERLAAHLAVGLGQVEAEEALRQSEAQYRALFAGITDAVFVHEVGDDGGAGRFLAVNDVACERLGYTREELLSMTPREIGLPEQDGMRDAHRDTLAAGGKALIETVHVAKDGRRFAVESHVRRFRYMGRDAALSISRDVTARKRTEAIMAARDRLLQVAGDCSLEEFLRATLDEVEAITGSTIGFYHFVEADQNTISLQVWSRNTTANSCTATGHPSHYPIAQAGVWVDCIRERRPVIHNDYASLPHRRGIPEGHAPVVRELVVPVRRGDRFVAVLGVGNKPTDYDEQDVEAVVSLADLAWETVEAKRAEAAMRASEALYRTLVQGLPDIVLRFDTEMRHRFASENVVALTGIPASAFIGKTDRELGFPEALCALWEEAIRGVFGAGVPAEREFVFPGPHGDVVLNWRLFPERDDAGRVRSVLSLSRDVTAQRQAEKNYRMLFREMVDGFALHEIICDAAGEPVDYRFLAVNPAFERMTGLRAEVVVGHTVREVLPATERVWIETYGHVALTGDPASFESYSAAIDKHFAVNAFRPAPGQFACIFIDITDRKRAEEALEKRLVALVQPLDSPEDITLEHLFNLSDLQKLQDDFARATGVASVITQPDGRPITAPSGFCRLCADVIRGTEKGRANCFRSDAVIGRSCLSGPTVQPCLSGGLWDAGAGISVGGRHIANWLIGQVRDETRTEDDMRAYAREIGADEEALVAAFREVPAMPIDRFEQIAQALFTLASQLSTIAYQNVQQARFITDRKRAEEALRQAEEQYRLLVDHSQSVIYTLTAAGTLTFVSPSWERLLGHRPEEVLHRDFRPLIHEEDRPRCREMIRRTVETGQVQPGVEYRVFHKDGSLHWHRSVISPVLDATGVPVLFVGNAVDITDRKRAEEALQQFKTVFDCAHFGAALADTGGVLTYVNASFAEAHGYRPEDLVGQPITVLHDESQCAAVEQLLRELLEKGRFDAREVGHRHRNGTLFPMLMVGTLVRDAGGAPHCFAATAIDITERKQLEAQLQHAQKMESVGRLAGGVAHDFNNMLGVIIGHTDFALEQTGPGLPVHANLQEIRKAAERSADLTRQLLAFARKQTIAPRILDLNETIEDMLNLLRRLIGEDIDLLWRPGVVLWPILADPAQFGQVLTNLCVNARDAIAGTGRITIETDTARVERAGAPEHGGVAPGEYVRFSVCDTGCGMTRDTMDHLFEPFFSTKEVGKGTGLGLAMVYGVVKQNNGGIVVHSQPGEGSVFQVYWPRHAGNTQPAAAPEEREKPSRGSETVLLLEDEAVVLKLVRTMLERLGYQVLTAGRPDEAIRVAEEYPGDIHLVITDVIMPEMNGRELFDRLTGRRPNLRSLFMSGYTADVLAPHGVLERGVHFIQKPFAIREFAKMIRKALA